jgi:hypothetical protein
MFGVSVRTRRERHVLPLTPKIGILSEVDYQPKLVPPGDDNVKNKPDNNSNI